MSKAAQELITYLWMTDHTLNVAKTLKLPQELPKLRDTLGICIKSLGTAIKENLGHEGDLKSSHLLDLTIALQEYLVGAAEASDSEVWPKTLWAIEKLRPLWTSFV